MAKNKARYTIPDYVRGVTFTTDRDRTDFLEHEESEWDGRHIQGSWDDIVFLTLSGAEIAKRDFRAQDAPYPEAVQGYANLTRKETKQKRSRDRRSRSRFAR